MASTHAKARLQRLRRAARISKSLDESNLTAANGRVDGWAARPFCEPTGASGSSLNRRLGSSRSKSDDPQPAPLMYGMTSSESDSSTAGLNPSEDFGRAVFSSGGGVVSALGLVATGSTESCGDRSSPTCLRRTESSLDGSPSEKKVSFSLSDTQEELQRRREREEEEGHRSGANDGLILASMVPEGFLHHSAVQSLPQIVVVSASEVEAPCVATQDGGYGGYGSRVAHGAKAAMDLSSDSSGGGGSDTDLAVAPPIG